MRFFVTLLVVSVLAGCATQETQDTKGTITPAPRRHPISVDLVKLYEVPPPKYQVLGVVSATESGSDESAKENIVAKLKKEAADLGANGIVLSVEMLKATTGNQPVKNADGTTTENVPRNGVSLAVQAIYVRVK